jgi:hypothetical protein
MVPFPCPFSLVLADIVLVCVRARAKEPWAVWTETPTGGAVNFITGAGGFLQVSLRRVPSGQFTKGSSRSVHEGFLQVTSHRRVPPGQFMKGSSRSVHEGFLQVSARRVPPGQFTSEGSSRSVHEGFLQVTSRRVSQDHFTSEGSSRSVHNP